MEEKIKCWEHQHCKKKRCPAYGSENLHCWLIEDTLCWNKDKDTLFDKLERCLECEVFNRNMDATCIQASCKAVATQFSAARASLETRDQELASISMEMAIGLSEVFEALKKIASGDPLVRIDEASDLELIVKLKQLVNKTALDMGEIVDLSHEFAIGLAEHFDVLHRVTNGDLASRISGESKIELLELLKQVTNQTISSIQQGITEREQAQASIMASEEKYRTLIDNIQDGVFLLQESKFIFINDALAKMVGFSVDEMVGLDFVHVVAPEDMERVIDRHVRRQSDSQVEREYEFNMLHKNGSTRVQANIHVDTLMYHGKVTMIGTIKDITERKLAEKEKRELQNRLQRSSKMEALGTLAGGVAHDLNNILSGIVSYPELLLMDLSEGSPLWKPIQTIKKSGERAAAIVQDLLTLARRGVATMEIVDLNHIIRGYLRSPEYDLLNSFHPDIRLEARPEEHLMTIMGSPIHLSKTVMNLISNAAEAMPSGGDIIISTENQFVDQPLRGYEDVKVGDYVVLKVFDSGVGISAKDMDQIFEPFYTKKVMGRSGTGLGMAVVWGTVKDHNGYIDIQSTEGQGATFTLYFPVTREKVPNTPEKIRTEDLMGNGEKILVVDDVKEQRIIATSILEKMGYHATAVSDGEAAVIYLKTNTVDLVVLDMIMDPGIDGLETFRRIRKLKPDQKAIIASGFSETNRVKTAQQSGAGEYVKKPYTVEKLCLAIQNTLK
ncbi:MAG: response regulator [Desulfobacterales bacterium]|nr:response regulator [Desulfobacterales bacterium]